MLLTGTVLAFVFGRPPDDVFLAVKQWVEPFGARPYLPWFPPERVDDATAESPSRVTLGDLD